MTQARAQLYTLEESLDGLTTADLNSLRSLRRRVQKASVHTSRYYTAARSAAVSVEVMPGKDAESVSLVKEYADRVEDLAHQLESLAELVRAIDSEIPAILARKQSRRIDQLTAISAVFLPITFLTGFFGMNFQWMIEALGSREAFLALAVALPTAMITVTVMLLMREGFIGQRSSNYSN
ncbi:hypothetical protein JO965_36715 (plasmid) [Microvirga sp. VF16]|nr:hypothetical protein JO965_36715 [Microvirga sp. VF16]